MARYEVLKEFNSLTRRFAPGMEIDGSEIDGAVPVERWVEMGCLFEVKAKETSPDFAAEQRRARAAWNVGLDGSVLYAVGSLTHIADQDLFGSVVSDEGPTVGVQVAGEEGVRHYPRVSVDMAARTVTGDYAAAPPPSVSEDDRPSRSRFQRSDPEPPAPVVEPAI